MYENDEVLRSGSLSQARLEDLLARIPAQKSLVILDTCDSGAFTLAARSMQTKAAIGRLMHTTGRAVLASSSSNQMALEGYKGHGFFTYALLQGLRGEADRNGDRQIGIGELANFVSDEVPRLTKENGYYEQFPMRLMRGHSFPIAWVE